MRCYCAYGLHIRSALRLPFDPVADQRAADVTVHLGAVPNTLPAGAGRLVQHPGVFLTQVEGVAR